MADRPFNVLFLCTGNFYTTAIVVPAQERKGSLGRRNRSNHFDEQLKAVSVPIWPRSSYP